MQCETADGQIVRSRRLEGIQVLRGLAAVAVLISHIGLEWSRSATTQVSARLAERLDIGRVGVDVFFVVSGFVMVIVSYSKFGSAQQMWRFLQKRIARIVPIYWFYSTLMLVTVLAPLSSLVRHSAITWRYVLSSYLFFPSPRPMDGEVSPLLDLGWTLNYEMYFYVLFAFALLFARTRGLTLLYAWLLTTVVCGLLLTPETTAWWFWTRPIVLEFLGGTIIGILFCRGIRISRPFVVCAAVAAILWFVFQAYVGSQELRLLRFGVPALVLVAATALTRTTRPAYRHWSWQALLLLGDASYSLYLSHMFVVRIASKVLRPEWFGIVYVWIYVPAVLAAALAVAVLSYRFLELPGQTLTGRWLAASHPRLSPLASN